MSLKKVKEVKADKFFRPADLIIYGAIAVLAAVLFAVLFATGDDGRLKGVRVFVKEKAVFEYDFEKNEKYVLDDCAEVSEGEKLTVRITVESGYNVIEIDRAARSVKVTEADCRSRDCVFSAAVTGTKNVIYCSPHQVRIEPYGFEDGKSVIM